MQPFCTFVLWCYFPPGHDLFLLKALLSSLPNSFSFYSHFPTPFGFSPASVSLMRPLFPVFLKVGSCTIRLAQPAPRAASRSGGFSPAGGVLRSQESRHLLPQPGAAALGQEPRAPFCSVLQAPFRWTSEIIISLGISRGKIRIFF